MVGARVSVFFTHVVLTSILNLFPFYRLSPLCPHKLTSPRFLFPSIPSGGFYKKAYNVLASLSVLFPTKLRIENHEYSTRDEYRSWLIGADEGASKSGFRDGFPDTKAHKHTSR